jgi:hypothetical protein
MITKSIKFVIDKVNYDATFPNVGQLLEIQNLQNLLTNNSYASMLQSGLKSAYFALDMVDAISFLFVMVPQLRKDLNVTNYNELDPFLAKKIVSAYKKQIRPWYNELMDELLKDDEIEPSELEDVEKE